MSAAGSGEKRKASASLPVEELVEAEDDVPYSLIEKLQERRVCCRGDKVRCRVMEIVVNSRLLHVFATTSGV